MPRDMLYEQGRRDGLLEGNRALEEQRAAARLARDDLWNAVDTLSEAGYFTRAKDCLATMQKLERAFGLEPKPWP